MDDVWSGLAYLLAELIERHISEIDLDDTVRVHNTEHTENDDVQSKITDISIDKERAARYNKVVITMSKLLLRKYYQKKIHIRVNMLKPTTSEVKAMEKEREKNWSLAMVRDSIPLTLPRQEPIKMKSKYILIY